MQMFSEEDLDEVLQTNHYLAEPYWGTLWLLHKAMGGRGNPVQMGESARECASIPQIPVPRKNLRISGSCNRLLPHPAVSLFLL